VLHCLNFRVKISIMGREKKINTWMDVVYSPHHVHHVWLIVLFFRIIISKISCYVFNNWPKLALWSLAVAFCSIRLNKQKLTILATYGITVFYTYLRTSRGLFPSTVLTGLLSWPIWKLLTARYEQDIEM